MAAEAHGPILELAVGSGRLAVPLAAAGHDVTGVDNDEAMLDRARAKWQQSSAAGRLTLIQHDLTTLALAQCFALVVVALNSVLLLNGRAAQERALKVMRAHLAPGGRAVVDVWLPTADDLALYDGRRALEWLRTDTETGERVAKTTIASYNTAKHTATLTTIFDAARLDEAERRITREDAITFITKDDLVAAARAAGLEPETIAGDYNLSPWTEASERVVLVLRDIESVGGRTSI
ncbi:MAG: methyltransferase domain-containing protein [Chloroflexota bacterium]|nr:methyltransferase domain-containing protein [Chloroflexota bacterium]